MRKTLIRVDNLDSFLCRHGKTIYVDSTMILSPGAKDALSKKGVSIVYGPCPDAASCPDAGHGKAANPLSQALAGNAGVEELLLGIAAVLKKECGITDPDKLKAASLQAVKTIKDNI